MKNGIFIFLVTLSISNLYGNDSCKNVNLTLEKKWGRAAFKKTGVNTRWNSAFKQMPLYDQGATGICYAYAAIQLTDYWRQTRGIRITREISLSSPIYAALLTRQLKEGFYFGEKDISGGDIADGIASIKHYGMCRDDIIQGVVDEYAKSKSIDQREFTEILESLFVNFPGNPRRIQRMSRKKIWNKYINKKFSFYQGSKIKNDGKIAKIFKKVAPYIENGNIVTLMDDLFKICKNPRSIYIGTKNLPDPQERLIMKHKITAQKRFMRELLNRKNAQPIGIGYCSEFLTNKKYIGTKEDPEYDGQMTAINEKTCGGHASVIIGKRNIGGKCHYLIRNTWGNECDYAWECRYNAKKEVLGVWVTESALFRNLTDITWMEKPDYVCLAKNRRNEQVFTLLKPDKGINDRQEIELFNKSRVLLITVTRKNQIEFLYGKDYRSLYTAKEIRYKDFIRRPNMNAEFKYRRKKLDFKLVCLPNKGDRSKIVNKLKQSI